MNIVLRITIGIALTLVARTAAGHEIPVHRAITVHAAASAYTASPGYLEFIDMIAAELPLEEATNFMAIGSALEDAVDEDVGGKRSYNHFYDPLTRLGLSNIPPDDRIPPLGKDSFTWASERNCPGVNFGGFAGLGRNVGKYNTWSWQNARDYEWLGITAASKPERSQALTDMFRAIGQVVHLLQDASQPQHVRNEHHVYYGIIHIWHSPIELYGARNLPTLNYQQGILNWRSAGFKRLEDFWDRHLYNGNAPALNADANSSAKLGLAEFANGNVVGDRHLFPEYFTPGKVAYYPFPSRTTSSNYELAQHQGQVSKIKFSRKCRLRLCNSNVIYLYLVVKSNRTRPAARQNLARRRFLTHLTPT